MTLVLHYAPDNASLIVRLVLEELGLPYETRLVNRAARAQEGAAYRAVNPAGLIPALETPDGVIFETGAILLWLADRAGRMAPLPDHPKRADFLTRLFFTSNTLHAQLRMTFYPEKYVDAGAGGALRQHLQALSGPDMTLHRALVLLDAMHRDTEAPTILDYYHATLLRWCALYPQGETGWFKIKSYPALLTMAQDLEKRPAVLRAAAAEGLGRTPFTAPRLATPPEGSAT